VTERAARLEQAKTHLTKQALQQLHRAAARRQGVLTPADAAEVTAEFIEHALAEGFAAAAGSHEQHWSQPGAVVGPSADVPRKVHRCQHELDPAECATCLAGPQRRPTPVGSPVSLITAQYPSRCPGCGVPIDVGDVIGRYDEQWLCEPCLDVVGLQAAMIR
jgi:hypothetical protein